MLQVFVISCLLLGSFSVPMFSVELLASESGNPTVVLVDGKDSTYDLAIGAKYYQSSGEVQDSKKFPHPDQFNIEKKALRPYNPGRDTEIWMLVKIKFDLQEATPLKYIIDHGYPSSEFSAYEYVNGQHNLLYSRIYSKSSEENEFLPLHARSFFRFNPKEEVTTLIFRFRSRIVSPIVFIRTESEFHKHVSYDLLNSSVFFCGIAILLIFNSAAFIATKNKENMLYALHLFFLGIANIFVLGVSSLIPSRIFVKYIITLPNTTYMCLSFGFVSLFVYEFFKLNDMPQKIFGYFKIYAWISIGIACFWTVYHNLYIAGAIVASLMFSIVFFTLFFCYKGLREAKFFLISLLPLTIGSSLCLYITFFEIEYLTIGMSLYSFGALLEATFVSMAIYSKNDRVLQEKNSSLKLESSSKNHILEQTSKIVHRHQLRKIELGSILEDTMPTTTEQACVISFDIIGSSKIQHIKVKDFFRNVFARCNGAISEGYDGENLKAKAYRIKEMGDGFLCSVGYPFASLTSNPANDAIELADTFVRILSEEAKMLHSSEPICCGIGIAIGTMTGFYPESGTKEYDLYGQGLILATRYEGMRKAIFEDQKDKSVLIIQELVFKSLDPVHREGFERVNLRELGIVVRDDPAATALYFRFVETKAVTQAGSQHLKAV